MDTELVKVFYDLGGTMSALLFCFGLVIFYSNPRNGNADGGRNRIASMTLHCRI